MLLPCATFRVPTELSCLCRGILLGRECGDQAERNMRIAIVSPEVNQSTGVPNYWTALARALLSNHEVHIFSARADRSGLGGVRFHRVPAIPIGWSLFHLSFYLGASVTVRLAQILQHRRFDVVMAPGPLFPAADLFIIHFVQRREMQLEASGAYLSDKQVMGPFRALDYALYGRFTSWLERRHLADQNRVIVAVSQSVKNDLVELFDLDQGTVQTVPNGVDPERFHPRNIGRFRRELRTELHIGPTEAVILFVGNAWGRKGLQTALDAIGRPGLEDLRLVVVGTGNPAPFMNKRPDRVSRRVTFVGSRASDIERYYAMADMFLLPTLYEPFGLVVLEAIATGIPALVSASAGVAELLHDGVDSLLLKDPTDADEIAGYLRLLIDAPDMAQRLATDGRRTAERLDWRIVADRLLKTCAA